MAHSILLKNDWDQEEAFKELKSQTYLSSKFQYSYVDAQEREADTIINPTFLCGVCYCDCDVETESVIMKDCYHMLCTDCFPEYIKNKVTSVDCVYATCPDKNCGLFVPPETFKAVLFGEDYERY